MRHRFSRWMMVAMMAIAFAGCGGGGGDSSSSGPAQPATTVKEAISTAAALPANDSSTNSAAPFAVLQSAGVPAVIVNSAPKVNFTVFSDGAVKKGLTVTNVAVVIAKLVPGTDGNPDRWETYTHRTRAAATATAGVTYSPAVKATLDKPAFASNTNPYTDPKTLPAAQQLVYNEDGYYTYTFSTDITDPTRTEGIVFDKSKTHRVAIQLNYVNAAGVTVRVNPYFDITFDASGRSVAVTDPARTRKMTDVAQCNGCHEKLALHGGNRVDTQFCVTCHNTGGVDSNSGNSLDLASMVHSLHAAKLLKTSGIHYTIRSDDLSEIGFPQDLRNCSACHSGSNPTTPQGDNWKTVVSKEACLTCHTTKAGGLWESKHVLFARDAAIVGANPNPNAVATDLTNRQCVACHKAGSAIAPDRVHWNQNEENAARYKMNIESVVFNDTETRKGRSLTVRYFLSDPTNGNKPYNLVTADCTGAGGTLACGSTTKFGSLRFYVAYPNMVGQNTAVTEFTSYNNGGSGANVYAYKGTNDGSDHYTISIPLPDDTATAVAAGTAQVVSIGQVKEPLLQVKSATDPRPEVSPTVLVNTLVQNTFRPVAISGPLNPRREIVSNEKCNVCHGSLGATSGSNTLANAFHGGARNTVQACVVCHDANRSSAGNMMTNGLALYEPYQFKRMIHGIHGNSKRTYPFTHGNPVRGAFGKDGLLLTAGSFFADQSATIGGVSKIVLTAGTSVAAGTSFDGIAALINAARATAGYTGTAAAPAENYAAEVAWPGVGVNCNACHVDNSYKVDKGPIGTLVGKPTGVTDPKLWNVITPKASTCTSCHDSSAAIAHVTSFGGAGFGNVTQAQGWVTQETCADCHSSGGFKGVDIVHGQK